MKQYEDVKKISGVEIAAPIANLGHYANRNSVMTVVTVTKGTGGEPVVFHPFLTIEMYDENVQEYGDKLNGAPTGIYGGDRIVQFEDAKGKKVNWYI